VIRTVAGDGADAGAVYAPLGEIVPQVAPAQPKPETVQVIARLGLELATGIKVAVKLAVAEVFMEAGPAIVSENELVIVIAAVTLFDGSATLIALMEALGGVVRICGALYIPVGSTVPQAAPTHPLPEIIQLIARSGLPPEFTVAANGRVAPNSTRTVCGKREIEISLVTVTTAAALFELSATLVARTVTEPEEGRSPGAVYAPLALIVPTAALPPGIPFTLQVTDVLVEFVTAAVNVCDVPSSKETEGGVRLTVMLEGGGCGGVELTTPLQPRKDATRSSAGHQRNNTFVKLWCPPCAVPLSIHQRIARDQPA
jgi:hypothetical protein